MDWVYSHSLESDCNPRDLEQTVEVEDEPQDQYRDLFDRVSNYIDQFERGVSDPEYPIFVEEDTDIAACMLEMLTVCKSPERSLLILDKCSAMIKTLYGHAPVQYSMAGWVIHMVRHESDFDEARAFFDDQSYVLAWIDLLAADEYRPYLQRLMGMMDDGRISRDVWHPRAVVRTIFAAIDQEDLFLDDFFKELVKPTLLSAAQETMDGSQEAAKYLQSIIREAFVTATMEPMEWLIDDALKDYPHCASIWPTSPDPNEYAIDPEELIRSVINCRLDANLTWLVKRGVHICPDQLRMLVIKGVRYEMPLLTEAVIQLWRTDPSKVATIGIAKEAIKTLSKHGTCSYPRTLTPFLRMDPSACGHVRNKLSEIIARLAKQHCFSEIEELFDYFSPTSSHEPCTCGPAGTPIHTGGLPVTDYNHAVAMILATVPNPPDTCFSYLQALARHADANAMPVRYRLVGTALLISWDPSLTPWQKRCTSLNPDTRHIYVTATHGDSKIVCVSTTCHPITKDAAKEAIQAAFAKSAKSA